MTWISYEFSSWYCLLYLRISTFCIHLWRRKSHRPIKHQWVYCPTRCFGVNHSERCTVCWSWGNIEWGEHTTWALLTFWLLQHFGQSTLKFCLPWASHGLLLFCFSWQMTCPIGKREWKDSYPATKSTCPGKPDSLFFKPWFGFFCHIMVVTSENGAHCSFQKIHRKVKAGTMLCKTFLYSAF